MQKRFSIFRDPQAPQTYNLYDLESPDGEGHSWTLLAQGLMWDEAQAQLQAILTHGGAMQLELFGAGQASLSSHHGRGVVRDGHWREPPLVNPFRKECR